MNQNFTCGRNTFCPDMTLQGWLCVRCQVLIYLSIPWGKCRAKVSVYSNRYQICAATQLCNLANICDLLPQKGPWGADSRRAIDKDAMDNRYVLHLLLTAYFLSWKIRAWFNLNQMSNQTALFCVLCELCQHLICCDNNMQGSAGPEHCFMQC